MRPKENIEKFVRVRKPHVTTSRQMDKRTLDDSFAAMEETIRAKSADHKPSTPRIITLSRMVKLAAAAALIILAVSFFSTHQNPGEQERPKIVKVTKSPVEMMTAMSLTIAYRRGGIEAVDRQGEKVIKMLGPRPAEITVTELLAEYNGT